MSTSPPLYFLPRCRREQLLGPDGQLARAVLAARGLDETLRDCRTAADVTCCEVRKGPSDGPGLLLVANARQGPGTAAPPVSGYERETQAWTALDLPHVAEADRPWLGWPRGLDCGPAELARRKLLPGYAIDLAESQGGGLRVQVPIVRRPDGSSELPRTFQLDAQDRLAEELRPEYRAIWEALGEALPWVLRIGDAAPQPPEDLTARLVRLAIELLGLNYRFDRHVQRRLGWLDSTNVFLVVFFALDGPRTARTARLAEHGEKKESAAATPAT